MKRGLFLIALLAICLSINAQSISVESMSINDLHVEKSTAISVQSFDAKVMMKNDLATRKELADIEKNAQESKLDKAPASSSLYYRRPTGYLISGLAPDYSVLSTNLILGGAYTSTQWKGNASNSVQNIYWEFNRDIVNGKEPFVNLPYGLYDAPILSGTENGSAISYQLGGNDGSNKKSYMQLGGTNRQNVGLPTPKSFSVGNYNLSYQFTGALDMIPDSLNKVGQYLGVGDFLGVANVFEKPASRFAINKFYVHCANLELYPDRPMTLNIYRWDNGAKSTLLATSTATERDLIEAASGNTAGLKFYTVPFGFKSIDPDDGKEKDIYLEINSAFFVEFAGYKSAVILGQATEDEFAENNAFLIFEEWITPVPELYEADMIAKTPWRTSFLFDMEAYFPFLVAKNDTYYAPLAGGTMDFEINAFWLPESWWLSDRNVPEWLTIGAPVRNNNTGIVTLPVTVAPSAGIRSYDLKFESLACDMTLKIRQGSVGIAELSKENVNVSRQGDDFQLTYPANATSVSIYNITGQMIAEYSLDASGTYTIPASSLAKGIYIFRLNGINATVKVIK